MSKSIATARIECTTKHENKTSYNTDYIVPGLINFLGDDSKEIRTWIEKRNIYICEKHCTDQNWMLVFSMNFLSTTWKNNVLTICISYWKLNPNALLWELFSYKILKNSLISLGFSYRSHFSVFFFFFFFFLMWGVSKSFYKN